MAGDMNSQNLAELPHPQNDVIDIHRSLAHTLCKEIAAHPHENGGVYFAKMLTRLIFAPDNSPQNRELITQAELLLEIEDLENSTRRHISNFIKKLSNVNENNTTNQTLTSANTTVINSTNNDRPRVVNNTTNQTLMSANTTVINSTNNDGPRVLTRITESENESLLEPQSKKSRRESDKENNVLQCNLNEEKTDTNQTHNDIDIDNTVDNSAVTEPQNKRIRKESETHEHKTSIYSESSKNRKRRRGGNPKNGNNERRNSLRSNGSQVILNPSSDDSITSNQPTEAEQQARVMDAKSKDADNTITSKTSEDNSNTNKNCRTRGKLSKNKQRSIPAGLNIPQSSSSDSLILDTQDSSTKTKDKNKNITETIINGISKHKNRGRPSINKERSNSSDSNIPHSSSSDNVISSSQDSITDKDTNNGSILKNGPTRFTKERMLLSEISSESREVPQNCKKKPIHDKNPRTNPRRHRSFTNEAWSSDGEVIKDSKNKNYNRPTNNSQKYNNRPITNNGVNSRNSTSESERQEISKNKTKSKNGINIMQNTILRQTRRNRQLLENSSSSESLSSNNQETTKATRMKRNNVIQENGKSNNAAQVSNTKRTNGPVQKTSASSSEIQETSNKTSKEKANGKIIDNEQIRRNGRFLKDNEKDKEMISQTRSQSIQIKRKKSNGASKTVEGSFDDTTILRTIVESSERHMSVLLTDISLPPTSNRKTLERRTLTVMSETSSDSGSPIRQVKKSRKMK